MTREQARNNKQTEECKGCKGIFISREMSEHFGCRLCRDCATKQADSVARFEGYKK